MSPYAVQLGRMVQVKEVDDAAVSVFEDSLERCLAVGDFAESFYRRFLGASDEVKEKFAGTDFGKQRTILERSLSLMARAALAKDDGLAHLESVARSHSKKQLDISPSLYALWLNCLVATAKEKDPSFSTDVESAWRTLLQRGIDRMVDVYRHEQTVPPPWRSSRP